MRRLFQRSKDAAVGFAARFAINSKLRGIGELTALTIDTKNRRLCVRLELVGEREPIDIDVTKYELRRNTRGAEITIHSATASKQWLNAAIREFVTGKSFPIPEKAEALLKLIA